MRIAFVWTNGVKNKEVFNWWNDGLRAAMRIIEKDHEVTYHEPDEDLPTVDWVLFWESPCTINSEFGSAYKKVMNSPQKTALLFSGGSIKREWVEGFDHIFVESKINKDEFDALGVKNSTAFGVNTDIFYPLGIAKEFTTVTHGTCAGWKRQSLAGEAMGKDALIFGRNQEGDPHEFVRAREYGAVVIPEGQSFEKTNLLINSAQVGLNCASFWGGGQRATLEAMACGLPVIVMNDSPKNMEYVQDSGTGIICNPNAQDIRKAVEESLGQKGNREYVMSKWTPQHYADAILNVIS